MDPKSRRNARLDEVLTGLRPDADAWFLDAVLNAEPPREDVASEPVRGAPGQGAGAEARLEIKAGRTVPIRLTRG
jgi:hypothetical protein